MPNVTRWEMWPTRLMAFEFPDAEFDRRLIQLVLETYKQRSGNSELPLREELRVYDFFSIDHPDVKTLRNRIFESISAYLGEGAEKWHEGFDLSGRAVIITEKSFIQTHVERREADLTIAYFPTGDGAGKALSSPGNPTFVVEDPSRYLTDLRLPHEERHSVHIAPRPGLLIMFPAHVPHHQQPYYGERPHIQIVCNVRIRFTEEYFVQKW